MHFMVLFLISAVQDPDRSTPEKAAHAFLEFYETWQSDAFKPEYDTFSVGAFCRTKEFTLRLKGKQEEWKMQELGTSSAYEVPKDQEVREDRAVIDVIHKFRHLKFNRQTAKSELIDEQLPIRLVLVKEGGGFLLSEYYDPCYACYGVGKCTFCKGSGTGDKDGKCFMCKGSTNCTSCKGGKLWQRKIEETKWTFAPDDWKPGGSQDLSSAKSAAQSYCDSLLSAEVEGMRRSKLRADALMTKLRVFYAGPVVKEVEACLARAPEEGKKALAGLKISVDSVEEKGDLAYAVLLRKDLRGESSTRIILKKVGETWLADAEQEMCRDCKGKGICRFCEGTGKNKTGNRDCWSCKGKKGCGSCGANGWKS